MASKRVCLLLACFFVKFFVIGSAKSCSSYYGCGYYSSKICCSDKVCRETCGYCLYDSQCGTGEECCNGDCLSACASTVSGGVIAGSVISAIVFFGGIFSIVACYFCACCPYYRHRSRGRVTAVQPFVTTTQTLPMQQMQQYPPPGNYNQPPPGYAQPPTFYPSYLQQPAQCPPPPAQGKPLVSPPVSV